MPGDADNSGFTRRRLLTGGLALGAATIALPMVNLLGRAGDRPPNLLFVFADQLRAQSLGCMGDRQVKTPNLDRMAGQGAIFTNAISGNPVCTPYRAMLLTGRYGHTTGVVANDVALPGSETTIAEVLKKQGYRTGYIGKWHLEWHREPFVPKERRQGFDYWAVRNCAHDYFDSFVCKDTTEHMPLPGYEPDAQTNLAIDYMCDHSKHPFSLFLSWGTPHNPYVAPDKYQDMYDPAKISQRPNVRGDYRATLARYYAMISNLDWNMGRLLDSLDQLGIADNTLVVFTSDHGDMLGSQGQELKQRPWEESINIPFILRYPGRVKAGSVQNTLLNSVDVMPTLLGLIGAPVPGRVQGRDISRFVLGQPGARPESVFLQNILPRGQGAATGIGPWRGVRTSRYTYARWRDKGWVLYDNALDPFQLNNLIDDPEAKSIRDILENDLERWFERTGDGFLSAEEWTERVTARRKAEGVNTPFS